MPLLRILVAALGALAIQAGQAQTGPVPIALEVQRLAPQLVSFAGSQANFESLVTGLALGLPVTLTTAGADGVTQTVSFVPPGGALSSPAEIARVLEAARQQLIASGIAAPSSQQLGTTLAGTALPVTLGTTASGTTPAAPGAAAAGATAPSPAEQLQSRTPAPRVNTSDSRVVGNTSDSPVPAAPAIAAPPSAPPSLEAPRPATPSIRRDR